MGGFKSETPLIYDKWHGPCVSAARSISLQKVTFMRRSYIDMHRHTWDIRLNRCSELDHALILQLLHWLHFQAIFDWSISCSRGEGLEISADSCTSTLPSHNTLMQITTRDDKPSLIDSCNIHHSNSSYKL